VTRLRHLGAFAIVLALAACSGQPPPPASMADGSSDQLPSGIVGDPGNPLGLGPPGRPFDAAAILDAMRDSRRPGGVPEELQTEEVAAAVADTIWTLTGEPWEAISAAGSCETTCTLELAGGSTGSAGEDVWVLSVVPEDAQVEVLTADLHNVPSETVDALDQLARDAEGGGAVADMLLASVRWQPPPDDARFVLAYRSGNEEESCSIDVELDVETETVTEVATSGC
jgi:hypothetical protein